MSAYRGVPHKKFSPEEDQQIMALAASKSSEEIGRLTGWPGSSIRRRLTSLRQWGHEFEWRRAFRDWTTDEDAELLRLTREGHIELAPAALKRSGPACRFRLQQLGFNESTLFARDEIGTPEVGRLLGVHRDMVKRWCDRGLFEYRRLYRTGGVRAIRTRELYSFIRAYPHLIDPRLMPESPYRVYALRWLVEHPQPDLLGVKAAAKAKGCSAHIVARMIREGRLAAVRLAGRDREWFIDRRDLEAWHWDPRLSEMCKRGIRRKAREARRAA